jgi:hypothetical protein
VVMGSIAIVIKPLSIEAKHARETRETNVGSSIAADEGIEASILDGMLDVESGISTSIKVAAANDAALLLVQTSFEPTANERRPPSPPRSILAPPAPVPDSVPKTSAALRAFNNNQWRIASSAERRTFE